MKLKDYKGLKGVTGFWPSLAWLIQSKEGHKGLILFLTFIILTLIFNPALCAALNKYLMGLLK
jgi:hypothetical protein